MKDSEKCIDVLDYSQNWPDWTAELKKVIDSSHAYYQDETIQLLLKQLDASTPAGYIGRRMMQVISTWYSKNLAVEARKGMKEKVDKGGWPKQAPIGYLNKHEKNSAWIEVDPLLGPLVADAFREMATGKWTLKEWADHAYVMGHRSRHGFRIAVSLWGTVFHNRIYLGETWLKLGDVPTKGNHQPLVDPDTFARVQEVLKAHDNYKQRTQHHKYLLQGLLFSQDTGTPCYVETHQQKKASYYRTKGKIDGSQVFYNTRDIDEQIPQLIKLHTISEDQKAKVETLFEKWFDNENKDNTELERAKQRLTKLDRMEKNLQELVLEDQISRVDFKQHRLRIEAERANLRDMMETESSRKRLVRGDFETALETVSKLDLLYENADNDNRRLLCETVFRRICVRNGKIIGVERNHPFELIYSQAKSSESFLSGQPIS